MAQCSTLRCVSGIWKNNEKPLISNGLRFVVTCLLAAALWVLFHQARHSFASQICLSQGVPIETVSKAMGHRNISTTQRYAKVTDEKVDRDVTILEHEITGKYTLSGIDQPPSTILKDMSLREMRRRERKEILNPMEGV